jgi:hypothetical protein
MLLPKINARIKICILKYIITLVLKDGQPYISSVRLEHKGLFKTDLKKAFIKINSEQYFLFDFLNLLV